MMLLILAQIYTHEQRRGTQYRSTFLGYVIYIYIYIYIYIFDNVDFFKKIHPKHLQLTDYLPNFWNLKYLCKLYLEFFFQYSISNR
jgi:hypothetical protein